MALSDKAEIKLAIEVLVMIFTTGTARNKKMPKEKTIVKNLNSLSI